MKQGLVVQWIAGDRLPFDACDSWRGRVIPLKSPRVAAICYTDPHARLV